MIASARTVLIVDTLDTGAEVQCILEADPAGYYCKLTTTPEAARALWHSTPPDVVVLSARLPERDGLALLAQLTSEQGTLAFATIVLLEAADQALVAQARALGAYACLFKTADLPLYIAQAAACAIEHLDLQREHAALKHELALHTQHSAAAAARDNDQKLAALVDQLPIGISILDAQGKVIYANSALANALRLSHDQVLAGEYERRSYIHPDGTTMHPFAFASARALSEQRLVQNVETGVIAEDGLVTWMNFSAMPIKGGCAIAM